MPSLRTGLPLFAVLFAAVALGAGLVYAGPALGRGAGATVLLTATPTGTPAPTATPAPGGSISGTVKDQVTGLPIAWATVGANNVICCGQGYGSTTVAADGSYTITGLTPGDYRVGASATGYASSPIALAVTVTSGAAAGNVNFDLVPDTRISGRVTDQASGLPIVDAYVYAYSNNPCCDEGSALTAADGSYVIAGLTPGNFWVRASAYGHMEEYFDNKNNPSEATLVAVTGGATTGDINFTLGNGGSISGRVTDQATGLAIAGAGVHASRTTCCGDGGFATTAADGSYTITRLMPGDHLVEVVASGYWGEYFNNTHEAGAATLIAVTEGTTRAGVDFSLARLGAISGMLTDQVTGLPLVGASVYAYKDPCCYDRYTATAADGSYTITGLVPGNYRINASANGYLAAYFNGTYDYAAATLVAVTEAATTSSVNFALASLGRISGKVTDQATGLPIGGAYVSVVGSPGSATSAADGSYTITGLATGGYRVSASAGGYVEKYFNNTYDYDAATVVAVTVGATSGGIDFALGAGGSISGTVRDQATGLPISGAFVRADRYPCCDAGFATTDFDGTYTIRRLQPGEYRIYAFASGYVDEYFSNAYGANAATPVAVTEGAAAGSVNFTLAFLGRISGKVTDQATGLPIAGASVSANGDVCCPTETTAPDGSYTITGLLPGNYRVSASATGYVSEYFNNTYGYGAATLVAVTEGATAGDVNFPLGTGGSISGTVTDQATGLPIVGAGVYAEHGTCCAYGYATTAANGSYTMTSLAPGGYRVSASTGGYLYEFFNNTYNAGAAAVVAVMEAATTSGVDFALGVDTDGDGCTNAQETGPDPNFGGDRNPLDPWDFFDVTGDRAIDLADTLAILTKFGLLPGDAGYSALYDRYIPDPLNKPWRTAAATGGIDLQDALVNLRSFGHSCAAPP